MANPASYTDVESRWRPLSDQEQVVATTKLDDAYRAAKRLVDDLDDKIAADTDYQADVVQVLAQAVKRVLANPDGRRAEQIDDYKWTHDRVLSSGELYFTEDELAILGVGEGADKAFTIDTYVAPTTDELQPVSVTGIPIDFDWS